MAFKTVRHKNDPNEHVYTHMLIDTSTHMSFKQAQLIPRVSHCTHSPMLRAVTVTAQMWCAHVCTHICTHAYAHVHAHMYAHVGAHVYTLVNTHVHAHVHTHAYTHGYMHADRTSLDTLSQPCSKAFIHHSTDVLPPDCYLRCIMTMMIMIMMMMIVRQILFYGVRPCGVVSIHMSVHMSVSTQVIPPSLTTGRPWVHKEVRLHPRTRNIDRHTGAKHVDRGAMYGRAQASMHARTQACTRIRVCTHTNTRTCTCRHVTVGK